jgi:glycosyltransferase involved in cell wall biosynthesis
MRILIIAWFSAPFGGLHSNIRQTTVMLMEQGHTVTIICPPGPFAKQMQAAGAQVITTDFKNHGVLLERVSSLAFDIVHAHPGLARMFAQKFVAKADVPLFITFHGAWLDDIAKYWQETSGILGVSPAIIDEILIRCPNAVGRVHLIPNATYIEPETPNALPKHPTKIVRKSRFNIVVATRLDRDKIQLVEFLIEILGVQKATDGTLIHWHYAGDGTELWRLKEVAAQAFGTSLQEVTTFYGWLPEKQLSEIYRQADFVVAPGRSAIDALGLGVPTVAVGSAGCFGLVTPGNYLSAAHCNFGGFGLTESKTAQTVFETLTTLAHAPEKLLPLGQKLRQLVRANHDQSIWDERLLSLYQNSLEDRDGETASHVSKSRSKI